MKTLKYIFALLIFGTITSCFNDLDTIPLDEDIVTGEIVYSDPDSYKQVLAKLYAGLAVSGQQGPAGQADIEGIDEGFGQYLRGYWYHQEFPTDEALVGWNDQTIADFHDQDWSAQDGFIFAFYSRIFYQIALANEFVRQTTDEKLDGRDTPTDLRTEIAGFRTEARFLRALSYWHALDLFRNVPFVTEEDPIGSFLPPQTNPTDLFNYLISELIEIEPMIAAAGSNEYARADQAAVWMLLAKLYLNAEVYIGENKYAECLDYCERIINSGYTLDDNYVNLFLADNHNSPEIIFPIAFDGQSTRTWGGMTFIIRAAIGGDMDPDASGVVSGWGGVRTTKQLVDKFPSDFGGIIVEATDGNTVFYPKLLMPNSTQDFDFTETDNSLSSPNADKIFEGYKYFATDNTELLFSQIPDANAPYFGDNNGDGSLDMFGANIVIAEAGFYYFRVDLNDRTYSFEKQNWGVLGDATSGGWDNDLDMQFNPEDKSLTVETELALGEIKFRANDNWDVNLGDDEADAILEYGGANIAITKSGTYTIKLFLDKPDYTYSLSTSNFDRRGQFHFEGQSFEIDDITQFTQGIGVVKFKNINSDGSPASDSDFPDTDFPMFRLADAYLMASEAVLRSGGSTETAREYTNVVRRRAFGNSTAGDVSAEEFDLDFLLDERAREFYWECHRRTDLIRFAAFSDGEYLWQWKGGVKEGRAVEAFRDVFPIPSSDINANPNLSQNEGY